MAALAPLPLLRVERLRGGAPLVLRIAAALSPITPLLRTVEASERPDSTDRVDEVEIPEPASPEPELLEPEPELADLAPLPDILDALQDLPADLPSSPREPPPADAEPPAASTPDATTELAEPEPPELPELPELPGEAPQLEPVLFSSPPPPYPTLARRMRWEGSVLCRISVAPDGRVASVALERSSGHRVLDDAALEAVADWRFRPQRAPAELLHRVTFELERRGR